MVSSQNIRHPVHVEMLTNASQQLDRAESLREQINKDGETIQTRGGLKDHPCLRHENAARSFVSRTVHRLAQETGPQHAKMSPVFYDLERMRERKQQDVEE